MLSNAKWIKPDEDKYCMASLLCKIKKKKD